MSNIFYEVNVLLDRPEQAFFLLVRQPSYNAGVFFGKLSCVPICPVAEILNAPFDYHGGLDVFLFEHPSPEAFFGGTLIE